MARPGAPYRRQRLREGATLIAVDNVESILKSASLCAALTADVWQDRLLSQSTMVNLPQRATWFATGNNMRLGGDMLRRCYWIRLDAKHARPWQRTEFRCPDLLAWVKPNRSLLIAALLTLARGWYAAGQPPADTPVLCGFEAWTRSIGGILAFAGIEGFLANASRLHELNDEDALQWEPFLSAWYDVFKDSPVTLFYLTACIADPADRKYARLRDALPDELADVLGGDRPRPNANRACRKSAGLQGRCAIWRVPIGAGGNG